MHALTASLLSLFLMTPLASGWLGVYLKPDTKKAVVTEVIPGTPAEKAGLKSGDILLSVGDTKTPTREQFVAAIQSHKAGARVKIRLQRNGRERIVAVRLGERPEDIGAGAVEEVVEVEAKPAPRRVRKPRPAAPAVSSKPVPTRAVDVVVKPQGGGKGYLGISVQEADSGLAVQRVLDDGPCAKSGLKKGDVIVSIGDRRIRSLDSLDAALKKMAPGRRVEIGVKNKNSTKSLMVKLGRRPGAGAGRVMLENKPVRIIEVVEVPKAAEPKAASRRQVRINRTKKQARPAQQARPARQARPAQQARPARPARPAKPARPSIGARPARPNAPSPAPRAQRRGRAVTVKGRSAKKADYNLEKELKALRKELKELRVMLNELRREGRRK